MIIKCWTVLQKVAAYRPRIAHSVVHKKIAAVGVKKTTGTAAGAGTAGAGAAYKVKIVCVVVGGVLPPLGGIGAAVYWGAPMPRLPFAPRHSLDASPALDTSASRHSNDVPSLLDTPVLRHSLDVLSALDTGGSASLYSIDVPSVHDLIQVAEPSSVAILLAGLFLLFLLRRRVL